MEGQQVKFVVDVKNIFVYFMDLLLINYWIEDVNRNKYVIFYSWWDLLWVGEILCDIIFFFIFGYGGFNVLWMEVNFYINGLIVIIDQLEQYYFNNVLQIFFIVNEDDVNLIFDVIFDGCYIFNNDIVSFKVEILIMLEDDNLYWVMDVDFDMILFGVYFILLNGV